VAASTVITNKQHQQQLAAASIVTAFAPINPPRLKHQSSKTRKLAFSSLTNDCHRQVNCTQEHSFERRWQVVRERSGTAKKLFLQPLKKNPNVRRDPYSVTE